MITGNLLALAQTSFKRMLAYSSIAHVGYILIGFATAAQVDNPLAMQRGLSAMVFYLVIYGVMNLGAFAGAILFSNETGSDSINDFAGLIKKRTHPRSFVIVMFGQSSRFANSTSWFFSKILYLLSRIFGNLAYFWSTRWSDSGHYWSNNKCAFNLLLHKSGYKNDCSRA